MVGWFWGRPQKTYRPTKSRSSKPKSNRPRTSRRSGESDAAVQAKEQSAKESEESDRASESGGSDRSCQNLAGRIQRSHITRGETTETSR